MAEFRKLVVNLVTIGQSISSAVRELGVIDQKLCGRAKAVALGKLNVPQAKTLTSEEGISIVWAESARFLRENKISIKAAANFAGDALWS